MCIYWYVPAYVHARNFSIQGDLEDLCLSFSITDDRLGNNKELDLIPGGSNVSVTSLNRYVTALRMNAYGSISFLICVFCRQRYINLVAKHYLHDRIKVQAKSFFK